MECSLSQVRALHSWRLQQAYVVYADATGPTGRICRLWRWRQTTSSGTAVRRIGGHDQRVGSFASQCSTSHIVHLLGGRVNLCCMSGSQNNSTLSRRAA